MFQLSKATWCDSKHQQFSTLNMDFREIKCNADMEHDSCQIDSNKSLHPKLSITQM